MMIKTTAFSFVISLALVSLVHGFDMSGVEAIRDHHRLLPKILSNFWRDDRGGPDELERNIQHQRDVINNHQFTFWGIGLLSGKDSISKVIQKKTTCEWSHMGLIFVDESHTHYFLEAGGSLKQIARQKSLPQVMLRKLDEVVAQHKGKIALRQLISLYGWSPNPQRIQQLLAREVGARYENSLASFVKAVDKRHRDEPIDRLYSSEMAAKWLMELCVISKNWQRAEDYLPKEFSFYETLPTTAQIRFTDEMIVQKKPKNRFIKSIL